MKGKAFEENEDSENEDDKDEDLSPNINGNKLFLSS